MGTAASTGGGASTGVASTGMASTGAASTGAASTGYSGSTAASTGAQSMGWGDDWRTRMAQGSSEAERDVKQLERYESPEQVWKKARELERRLSSGELRSTLKKDATAEEQARWRAENGVPAKPEEYAIKMPDGKAPPKDDDQFLDAFRKAAHASHYTQAQFDNAVSAFYQEVARQETAVREAEVDLERKTEDQLRADWGADYRVNKAMAEQLLSRAPAGFRDRFMNGYLSDRSPIKASAEAWKWLVQLEREINPAASVVPGAGGDPGKTIADELESIRKVMRTDRKTYDKDEKMQERYRQLLVAQAKITAKA